jgi:hypothetical protein
MESTTATRSSGRVRKPTDAVTNPNNTASFELTSHRVAAEAAKALAQRANAPTASHVPASEQLEADTNQNSPSTTSTTTTTNQPPSTTVEDIDDSDEDGDKAKDRNVNGEYIKDVR